MKKRFSTIILLLALVLTMSVLGCKGGADLDMSKVKKWNDLQSLNDPDLVQCIELVADKNDIDWWIITNQDGVVLEPEKDYIFVDNEGNKTSGTESKSIEKGNSIFLEFAKTDDVVVWIFQDDVDPKDFEKGTCDFRGRVNIESAQGFKVKASSYREEVQKVGIIKLTCNETGNNGSLEGSIDKRGNWSGSYDITEVWPLEQKKDSPLWDAIGGYKLKFNVNEGESKRIVYPAGDSVFALKQPYRFADADKNDSSYEEQKNWYWCLRLENNANGNVDTLNGYFGPIVAHELKKLKSGDCIWHFDIDTKEFEHKSALGSVYTINDSDIVDGADIK